MNKITKFRSKNNLFFLSVILFSSIFLSYEAIAQKVDFSGNWTLNESKGTVQQEQGRGFRAAQQLAIKQEGNVLSVDKTRIRQNNEPQTNSEKYTLEGIESINASQRGGTSKSIVKWSDDGKSLGFQTTRTITRDDGQSTTMKSSEKWSLTDPKTLSISITTTNREGIDRTMTYVYDKK